MYCSNCSGSISELAKSCPHCGHPIKGKSPLKSKAIFVVLALLLGGIGVHRMYIGDVGLGILYLLFFWTGIPMVIAFIEAIYFALKDNDPRFQ